MEELQSSQLETYNFIKKQLENFKKSPKDRLTKANLETRLELLESYWEKFQSKHDALAAASGENRSQLSYFKNNINDDCMEKCLTSLKAIDIPTDHWDDIIVYIVIQKLDAETHRHFEQRIETLERLPTWKDLSEFLELRFRTLEAVKCKDTQPHTRNATTAKSLTASVTSPMNCEKSIELENIDRNNSAHNSSMDRITMRASIDTSPVILATALVKVQSKNHSIHILRALVDQGSQASLITEGACQELGLKRAPILGNIVGVSSNNTVTKALVEFEITSRHDPNKKIKVSAYVLRTLTSYIPQRVQAVDWPELECLQLADNTFKQPGRVDLLLGAEIFADIIQQGIIVHRDEKSSLVAQETSLGWLISGNSKKSNNQQPIVVTHHAKIEIETTL
ncbi:putative bel12 ag transposon polyprotein, partial [Operophtera brumata]